MAPPQPPQPKLPPLSEQVIEQMVQQQGRQLEVRLREIQLREREIDQQGKYAEKALGVQAEDLKDQRLHEGKQSSTKLIAAIIALIFVLAFLGTCILTGHEVVALEIVKAVGFILTGGAGGYAIGRNRAAQKASVDVDET